MSCLEKIRLMLVDDHFLIRMGLAGSCNMEADMIVVAECGNGPDAVTLYRRHRPDVVLMDYRLPGMDGVQAAAEICREFDEARIVLLSAFSGEEDVYRAAQAGVAGYLHKSIEREELLRAIRTVHGGQRYFPPLMAERLAGRLRREALSARELEVLQFIVGGASNKEVAAALNITEVTVKMHVSHLLAKLRVNDRTQAVTAAIRQGIVHLE